MATRYNSSQGVIKLYGERYLSVKVKKGLNAKSTLFFYFFWRQFLIKLFILRLID